jgi:FTR1 family protein
LFDAFLVTWREFAEALLIVAMFRACFVRAGREEMLPIIGRGVVIALVAIVLSVAALQLIESEPAFDALCTIAAALSVAMMAVGVAASGRGIDKKVSGFVMSWMDGVRPAAAVLVMIVFLVLREGLELFVMLRSIHQVQGPQPAILGALLGLVAVFLTTRIWVWARSRFGLMAAFRFSAVLLLALAVKMLIHGCEELLRMQWLPIDHERWEPVIDPFRQGGDAYMWLFMALFAPPLMFFLKSWWQEASWKEPGERIPLK